MVEWPINRRELAKAMGVPPVRIGSWVADGMPVHRPSSRRGEPALYMLSAVRQWRLTRVRDVTPVRTLAHERALLTREQVVKLVRENQAREQEFVAAETVTRAVRRMIPWARAQLWAWPVRAHQAALIPETGVEPLRRLVREILVDMNRDVEYARAEWIGVRSTRAAKTALATLRALASERSAPIAGGSVAPALEAERSRQTREVRAKTIYENLVTTGVLVSRAEVQREVSGAILSWKSKFRTLPKVAAQLLMIPLATVGPLRELGDAILRECAAASQCPIIDPSDEIPHAPWETPRGNRIARRGAADDGPSLLERDWVEAWAPPPSFTVSEWADAHRRLPETSAARGGRWQTSSTPYLRGIMDAALEPGVKKIAVMGGAQLGKSEALHNILGYFIAHDPCPMLFIQPSVEVAEEWSKERLADMLRSTDVLRALVQDKRQSRESAESTLTYKVFPGGYLALGGSNTPNTYARRAARIVICDDVDRFPPVVADEGDPAELAENRTRTFLDGLVLFVSTPSLKKGRIDTLYERSDQRRYLVTCPVCAREDWVTWNDPTHFRIGFEGLDPSTARLKCPAPDVGGCGAWHDEPTRRAMVAGGRWRATTTATEAGYVGFHLPTLVSTLGDVTLGGLVEKWLSARAKGKESLRVFVNTTLAEGWEDRGARMNPHALLERREDYGEGIEVPAPAAALTAGVDVQENRFELSVFAWGVAGERWLVDHRAIPGNPKHAETRAALLEALSRKYAHALGPLLPIHAVCIDTGYATEEMYDFVLAYQARRIFATKGFAGRGGEPIVGKPSEKRHGRGGRPVRLYPINVDDGKADVMAAVAHAQAGPGCCHFPQQLDAVDEEYFAQLCAEHRETRYNRGGVATHSVWVQDRERNEALDCAVLGVAAYRLLNPNVRQMLEAVRAAATVAPSILASPESSLPARPPAAAGRRVARSAYLQ